MRSSSVRTPPAPVIFLLGEDLYAKEECLRTWEATGLVREYLLAGESTPAAILDSVRTDTLDLFAAAGGGRRLVVVDQAEVLRAADWKLMSEYFRNPSSDVFLAFLVAKKKRDWSPHRWVPPAGLIECNPLRGGRLESWLGRAASERGISLTPGGSRQLLRMGGEDRFLLAGELDKLALGVPGGAAIGQDEVLELAGQSREANVFDLADDVFSGRPVPALTAIGRLVGAGESPVGILAVISRRHRQLARLREVLEEGKDESTALREARVSWYKKETLALARRLPPERIGGIYRELLEADAAMKTSGGSPRLALERVVLRIAGGG